MFAAVVSDNIVMIARSQSHGLDQNLNVYLFGPGSQGLAFAIVTNHG